MWAYLGEEIDVKEDGLFYVKGEFFESLAKAKSYIAQQKKSYYCGFRRKTGFGFK